MRIVYPESRRFRISFVVERVCRSANTGCPVPSRRPDFLCRISSCGLPRVRAAAFSRTGPGRGREGVVSGVCMLGRVPCPYNLQACADMPGQGYPSGGAPGAGASSLPATDSTSLFQQASPPEAGLRLSSFGTAGSRPELPASFAPRLPASLTPGRSGSPRPGSGDMVSYGRGVSSPGQDASGPPQVIPNNML